MTNAGNKARAAMAALLQHDFSELGIKLNIVYGPEVGEIDMLDREEIYFPVHRGL